MYQLQAELRQKRCEKAGPESHKGLGGVAVLQRDPDLG